MSNCNDKCGEKVLFTLGDQSFNKCKFFEPSEFARTAWETFKLDKVDWLCGSGHTTKGMSEGTTKPCGECDQTFDERLENFLTIWLREVSRVVGERTHTLFREDRDKAPPAVEYTVFLPLCLTQC